MSVREGLCPPGRDPLLQWIPGHSVAHRFAEGKISSLSSGLRFSYLPA